MFFINFIIKIERLHRKIPFKVTWSCFCLLFYGNFSCSLIESTLLDSIHLSSPSRLWIYFGFSSISIGISLISIELKKTIKHNEIILIVKTSICVGAAMFIFFFYPLMKKFLFLRFGKVVPFVSLSQLYNRNSFSSRFLF